MKKEDIEAIAQLSSLPGIKLKIESDSIEHPTDASLRRGKDWCLFIFALFAVVSAFIYCGWQVVIANNQEWPLAIDSSILSALLGYLVGKKTT